MGELEFDSDLAAPDKSSACVRALFFCGEGGETQSRPEKKGG